MLVVAHVLVVSRISPHRFAYSTARRRFCPYPHAAQNAAKAEDASALSSRMLRLLQDKEA